MAIKGVVASSGGKAPTSISTKAVSAGKAAVSPKSSPAPSYKQTSYITPTYQTIQSYNTPSYAPPAAPAAVPKATTISQQAITAGKAQISQPKPAQIAPGIATISDLGAVGGQKKVSNSDGGYSLLTRTSEDTYNVTRYSKDGKLLESYSKKPGETIVTGVQPSSLSESLKLTIKSIPSSSKVIEEIEVAEGGREGDSTSQSSASATKSGSSSVLPGFKAPETPQGFEAPAAPVSFEAPETPETFVSVVEVEGRDDQQREDNANSILEAVKAASSPEVQFPAGSADYLAPLTSAPGIVSGVLNAPSSQEEITVEASPTDWTYGFPETEEQKLESYRIALEKYNPDGEKSGDNDLIKKYFGPLVPYIVQQTIDPSKLGDAAYAFEDYRDGSVSKTKGAINSKGKWVGEIVQRPFNELSWDEQTAIFRNMVIDNTENEVPIGYTLVLIDQLIDSETSESTKQSLTDYVNNGQLDKDVTKFGTGSPVKNMLGWIKSDAGLTSIGVIAGMIGVGAALATGGLAAAGGATLMSTFSTTELKNAFGKNAFVDKARLENQNLYAKTHKEQYNEIFKSTESKSYDFSKYYKDQTPEQRLASIAALEKDLEYLGTRLGEEHVFLEYMGIYDQEVERYHNVLDSLNNYKNMVDSTTGELTSARLKPAEITLIPPAGGRIEGDDLTVTGSVGITLTKEDQGMISYKVYDAKGNLVKTDSTSYYPGNVITKDYTDLLAYESTKNKSSDTPKSFVRTIYLQPGQSMSVDGQTFTAKGQTVAYDVPLVEGIPKRITFSQAGKEDLVEYFGAQGVAWGAYSPQLKDSYVKSVNEVTNQGFKLATSPQSTVKINGKVYAAQGDKDTVPTAPGYYQVEVSTPGKETWQKTVYIGEGQYMSISDASQDVEEEKSYSSSSGGGGGGGGGSSGGSEDVTYAMIIYGETCRNARVWQDDTEIAPEIGKIYSISPGYHAIKVQKTGKKVWLKTVYCMAGDSVTVSPALEDETSTTTPTDTTPTNSTPTNTTPEPVTRRVYFNSDPSSSRVMINGGFSGEWTPCFLDLPHGYYKVQILKTGYKPQDHTLYVGSVIAWDSYADQLANMEGIYFD